MRLRIRGRRAAAVGAVAALACGFGAVTSWPADAASSSSPSISGNWAGYVATGSAVTSVTGTWTVPDAGAVPPGASSTWAGIGGFSSSDLIQAGTQQVSSPVDQFITGGAYAAWYEMLPANPVYVTGCTGNDKCTVNPGDHMSTTITNQGGDSWLISISDSSAGWSWDNGGKTFTYHSTESSAEWIHEAPSAAGLVPVPVGNSGTVTFDGSNSAVIGGRTQSVAGSRASPVEALPAETTTSALDTDGDGFSVCTYTLSCAAPPS